MHEGFEQQEDDGFYAQPDGDTLVQFCIYELPDDHPKHYVVRRIEIHRGRVVTTKLYRLGRTLEEARAHVPEGLVLFTRDPRDAPVIVETWT